MSDTLIRVKRVLTTSESTLGQLLINGKEQCWTLEDEKRDIKVAGETRIPKGRYEINFRTVGGHHQRYLKKYGQHFHHGMLQIMDVPNFEYILIHIGNNEQHTAGCLLVGESYNVVNDEPVLLSSEKAYLKLYYKIAGDLLNGRKVFLEID